MKSQFNLLHETKHKIIQKRTLTEDSQAHKIHVEGTLAILKSHFTRGAAAESTSVLAIVDTAVIIILHHELSDA